MAIVTSTSAHIRHTGEGYNALRHFNGRQNGESPHRKTLLRWQGDFYTTTVARVLSRCDPANEEATDPRFAFA